MIRIINVPVITVESDEAKDNAELVRDLYTLIKKVAGLQEAVKILPLLKAFAFALKNRSIVQLPPANVSFRLWHGLLTAVPKPRLPQPSAPPLSFVKAKSVEPSAPPLLPPTYEEMLETDSTFDETYDVPPPPRYTAKAAEEVAFEPLPPYAN